VCKFLQHLLRHTKIAMILSSVFMTLLLLRYNRIPLYQSSNFVWFLSNYPRSGTILLGIIACSFMFIIGAGASVVDISVSNYLYSFKTLFVICKNPSCCDNVSILSILLKLILAPLCSLHYTCFVCHLAVTLSSFICGIFHYTSLAR